jgi:hypothetical protein
MSENQRFRSITEMNNKMNKILSKARPVIDYPFYLGDCQHDDEDYHDEVITYPSPLIGDN